MQCEGTGFPVGARRSSDFFATQGHCVVRLHGRCARGERLVTMCRSPECVRSFLPERPDLIMLESVPVARPRRNWLVAETTRHQAIERRWLLLVSIVLLKC
jgi:hypothetical protein